MKKLYMTPQLMNTDVKIQSTVLENSGETDEIDPKSRHAFDDEAAIASMNGSTKMSLW